MNKCCLYCVNYNYTDNTCNEMVNQFIKGDDFDYDDMLMYVYENSDIKTAVEESNFNSKIFKIFEEVVVKKRIKELHDDIEGDLINLTDELIESNELYYLKVANKLSKESNILKIKNPREFYCNQYN